MPTLCPSLCPWECQLGSRESSGTVSQISAGIVEPTLPPPFLLVAKAACSQLARFHPPGLTSSLERGPSQSAKVSFYLVDMGRGGGVGQEASSGERGGKEEFFSLPMAAYFPVAVQDGEEK